MKLLEFTLWIAGAMLLLLFAGVLGWQEIERRHEITAFMDLQRQTATARPHTKSPPQSPRTRDSSEPPVNLEVPALAGVIAPESTSTDAPELTRAALSTPGDVPIAILRIPAIGLVVPVNIGTGSRALRRGAGLVAGSTLPGDTGNVAIAAHRDSFFRGLKDISVSDTIELDTLGHTQLYRITKLSVALPTDVSVLADVGQPVLTLITCYPFYFVGHAPKRFIVRAVATNFRR
ncbi:MAG: sortase [Rhodanobacteraceae bacterium]